jgi:hypothetical protein
MATGTGGPPWPGPPLPDNGSDEGDGGHTSSAALAARHAWRQLLAIRDRHLRGSLPPRRPRRRPGASPVEPRDSGSASEYVSASSDGDDDADGLVRMAIDGGDAAAGASTSHTLSATPPSSPSSLPIRSPAIPPALGAASSTSPTPTSTVQTSKRRRLIAPTSPASPPASPLLEAPLAAAATTSSPELRPVRAARPAAPSPTAAMPAPLAIDRAQPVSSTGHPFTAQLLRDFGHPRAAPAFLRLHARRLNRLAARGTVPLTLNRRCAAPPD